MLKAIYLPVNQVWGIFSDTVRHELDGQYSWNTLEDLRIDLKYKGLTMFPVQSNRPNGAQIIS